MLEILFPVLENASECIPRSQLGATKSPPRREAHTRISSVWEYPPPPPTGRKARDIQFIAIDVLHRLLSYDVHFSIL